MSTTGSRKLAPYRRSLRDCREWQRLQRRWRAGRASSHLQASRPCCRQQRQHPDCRHGFCARSKVAASTGVISTIAGTGSFTVTSGSGTATTTAIGIPLDVAAGPDGSVYIAATDVEFGGGTESRIWKVLAGPVDFNDCRWQYLRFLWRWRRRRTAAQLNSPTGVIVDSAGNIFIADTGNHRVRRINASDSKINTVSQTGIADWIGDGIPATSSSG